MKKKKVGSSKAVALHTFLILPAYGYPDTISPMLLSLVCMNIFPYQSAVRNVMYHTIFILDTVSTRMEDNIELCSKGICTWLKTKDLHDSR